MEGVVGVDRKVDVKRLTPDGLKLLEKAKTKEWNSMRNFGVFRPISKREVEDLRKSHMVRNT
jgi:hypothetical protein